MLQKVIRIQTHLHLLVFETSGRKEKRNESTFLSKWETEKEIHVCTDFGGKKKSQQISKISVGII